MAKPLNIGRTGLVFKSPVNEDHDRGNGFRKLAEPFGGFRNDVDKTKLNTGFCVFCIVEEAELNSMQHFVIVYSRKLSTFVTVPVVEQTEADSGTVAGSTVDKTERERSLRVFSPDAQGQSIYLLGAIIKRNVRGQTGLEGFAIGHSDD